MKYTEVFEQELNEINMSPTSLDKLSGQINAVAGMEFEMIVPDTDADGGDDFESEPDLDYDESARSFSDIREFFNDGDHNSRRAVDRLEQELINNYYDSDFLSEKKQEAWGEASHDSIRDLVERDYEDELRSQAEEEVQDKTPEFGVNSDELDNAIADRFTELFDAKVDEILSDMGPEYDEAYEEWEQNEWQELANDSDWQEEWLEDEGITTMWDVADRYSIEWPHWTEYEGGGGDVDDIADEFSNVIGRSVNASSSYHGATREQGKYVVEPDSSLEPDNRSDAGLEFVSPPLPISELLVDLDKVKNWADNKGCYTNSSTGLHINVSVPNFSIENLDYVKLALLLGDQYVLDQFGRAGNHYCKSAMKEIISRVGQRPEDAANLLNAMKKGLGNLATKIIHSGSTSKYTSINTKTGYIEFRSPGGNWLDDEFFTKIKPTLLRFVVALDAAMDPQKYREEYLKKLYALLQPKSKDDTLSYFAKFSAGELPKQALKSFIRQAQLERKVEKDPTGGQKYWWSVGRPGYFASVEVVASSKEEAIEKGLAEYPDWRGARDMTAKPIKPYDESPVRASVGEPQAIGQRSGPAVGDRPSNPEGGWVITPEEDRQSVYYRFNAADLDDANIVVRQWRQEHPNRVWIVQRDPNQTLGQPPVAGSTLDLQRQRAAAAQQSAGDNWSADFERRMQQPAPQAQPQTSQQRPEQGRQQQPNAPRELRGWKIVLPNGREVHQFTGIGNNQGDANRIASEWLRNNGYGVSGEGYEVVPVWGE
jgi:hypothetical protein